LVVYRHFLDLLSYLITNRDVNELMISTVVSAFLDAVYMPLWNHVERRAVLENLDLVLLCLDGAVDEGYVARFVSRISSATATSPPSVFSLGPAMS